MTSEEDGTGRLRVSFVMLGRRDLLTGGYLFNSRMIEHLRAMGVEVDVIHFTTVPPGLPEMPLAASRYVLDRVRDFAPDVVLVSKSYQFVPLLRMRIGSLGIPVVCLVHDIEWKHQRSRLRGAVYRVWARWVLSAAATVWTNSLCSKRELEELGVRTDRIRVIAPGFDRPSVPPPDREGREGPVRFLCVGSFVPRKGQDILLRACAGLPAGGYRLDLAGGGGSVHDSTGEIASVIERERLGDSVRIVGELGPGLLDMAYRDADVLVHPALWESYGMCVVEAMARGLPVIASDVAALPELVDDGDNGLLVAPGDAAGLRAAMLRLMTDREMRLRMGERSFSVSLEKKDWESTCREFGALVAEAAGWKIPG
jgi:glycosyltransferase involved in cell wall biosynthesis